MLTPEGSNMRILGVDPALTTTGYGLIDCIDNHLQLVEAGIIKTSPRNNLTIRLEKIHRGISILLKDTRPDCMVLEKLYAHYRHPTTAFILGEARGVICLASAQAKVPLIEYPATRVKKAIVGRGLAPKYQIQAMVAKILMIDNPPKYSDVTDALALAIAHTYFMRVNKQGYINK